MSIFVSDLNVFCDTIDTLPESKLLINTLNANSFNIAQTDKFFREALLNCDILLPDGIAIVIALRFLNGQKLKKIAGSDLFFFEMERLNRKGGKCFFLGSSTKNLDLIIKRASSEFPNVKVFSYSPPFKKDFSIEENAEILNLINSFEPDVLFVGMTAPKQEKWAYQHFNELNVFHVCCIGAVFDYYSRRINRAPKSLIIIGLEWFHRLIKEPRRMWHRYLIGNPKFIFLVVKEKLLFKK